MRRALGKGISQLLNEQPAADTSPREVAISAITPNPRQPRTHFEEGALAELAESIKLHGVLQPLLVRPVGSGKYELIAGERRFRASKLAGLKSVPVVIRTSDARGSLELALIENLQREDIGPLESARAYRRLIDEFGLTQELVAERVGKSRTAVANTVRLLRLPPRIQVALESGEITEGHARPLLALEDPAAQLALFDKIVRSGMTSKEVERTVKPIQSKAARSRKPGIVDPSDPNWRALESRASEILGSPVKLEGSEKGGTITVRFFSEEDLLRIMDLVGVQI
jgi:ParB family chromosome partitioning protein